MDWVGRPEQTNMRLNNPRLTGSDDIRDLWNQQTPFAIDEKLRDHARGIFSEEIDVELDPRDQEPRGRVILEVHRPLRYARHAAGSTMGVKDPDSCARRPRPGE